MDKQSRLNYAYNYLKSNNVIHTQKEIAEAMGASQSNVSSALKGVESVLTDRFLMRFADTYKKFNINWLLYGEGPMLRSTDEGKVLRPCAEGGSVQNIYSPGSTTYAHSNVYNNTNGETTTITKYKSIMDVPTAAEVMPIVPTGLSTKEDTDVYSLIVSEDECLIGAEYVSKVSLFSDAEFCYKVQDDAMEPKFDVGDIVALRRLEEGRFIINGKAYVIDTKSYGLILRYIESRGEDYVCHASESKQSRYKEFAVPKSEVYNVFKIKGSFRTNL